MPKRQATLAGCKPRGKKWGLTLVSGKAAEQFGNLVQVECIAALNIPVKTRAASSPECDKGTLRRSQLEFKRKLDRSRTANLIEGVETCIIAACKAVRK